MIDMEKICWPGWKTVGLIGRGSFGAVYEIQRDVLGETERAALKVISIPQNSNDIDEMYSEGYDDESVTATFKEHLKSIVSEYSLMRKMSDCVNIVKCDDIRYVQHDDGIGWDIFIKMELLTPLTKALPEAIPERMVIKLAKDICAALDTCKKYEVIHRDIKPQNIFVSSSGDYKLGDFGIAKVVERTAGGTKIGTYKYMAPEVYNNQPYGRAVDIYSLGLVLYWMLNGRRMPFLPESSKVTARMEEEARIRRFDGERLPAPANGSARLKAIVLKACAFHPADRYKTPQEMLEDLKAAEEGSSVSGAADKTAAGNFWSDSRGMSGASGENRQWREEEASYEKAAGVSTKETESNENKAKLDSKEKGKITAESVADGKKKRNVGWFFWCYIIFASICGFGIPDNIGWIKRALEDVPMYNRDYMLQKSSLEVGMEIALIVGTVVSWLYARADKQKKSLRVKGAWLILTTFIFIGLNIIEFLLYASESGGIDLPSIVSMALVFLPFTFIIIIVLKDLRKNS